MATWITPVIDRNDGSARMTYDDMERITGNLEWLFDECTDQGIPISGPVISKTSWIRNDIITVGFWAELLDCLANVCTAVNYTAQVTPDDAMTYQNINNVEKIELECYDILNAYDYIPRLNHYVGDPHYAGDDINMGGRYE